MKKTSFAMAMAIGGIASSAWAQTSQFTGWSLGLQVDSVATWTEFMGGGVASKISDSSQNVALQAAYGMPWGRHGVLSFGMTHSLGDVKAGSIHVGGTTVDFRLRNLYSFYIEPGYEISDAWLGYAKLGYFGVRNGEETANGVIYSKTFGGLGYGLGVRTMLYKNLYLQIEYTQADYNRKQADFGTYRSMTSTGSIGLGYRF